MICPENYPIILGHEPVASNAIADTADAICLKGAKGVLILISEDSSGGDTDLVLTVHEGDTAAVAAAGTYPITTGKEFPIWTNLDCAATDLWTRQADGLGYTIDATPAKLNQVAFYIPASKLTNDRDWIALGASGGNAGNKVAVTYILDGARYQQKAQVTAIA